MSPGPFLRCEGPIVHNVVTLCLGPWDKKVHLKQVVICCDCQNIAESGHVNLCQSRQLYDKNEIQPEGISSLSVGAHSR